MVYKHIVVSLQKEGFHSWPEASEVFGEDVKFLEHNHRHIFYIRLWKSVEHNDRDIEIILFKRQVESYLEERYGNPMQLGRRSCEDLAEELAEYFESDSVEVLEDGENGAAVTRTEEVQVDFDDLP